MTSYRSVTFIATTAVALLSAPANAQSVNDVRCALASNAFATSAKGDSEKQTARDLLYYYIGRIDSQLSAAQIKAEYLSQKKLMSAANLSSTMQACYKAAQARIKAVQSAGR
jgi:hypothetical protein